MNKTMKLMMAETGAVIASRQGPCPYYPLDATRLAGISPEIYFHEQGIFDSMDGVLR